MKTIMRMTYFYLVKKQLYRLIVISIVVVITYKITSFCGAGNPIAKSDTLICTLAGTVITYLFILPLINLLLDK